MPRGRAGKSVSRGNRTVEVGLRNFVLVITFLCVCMLILMLGEHSEMTHSLVEHGQLSEHCRLSYRDGCLQDFQKSVHGVSPDDVTDAFVDKCANEKASKLRCEELTTMWSAIVERQTNGDMIGTEVASRSWNLLRGKKLPRVVEASDDGILSTELRNKFRVLALDHVDKKQRNFIRGIENKMKSGSAKTKAEITLLMQNVLKESAETLKEIHRINKQGTAAEAKAEKESRNAAINEGVRRELRRLKLKLGPNGQVEQIVLVDDSQSTGFWWYVTWPFRTVGAGASRGVSYFEEFSLFACIINFIAYICCCLGFPCTVIVWLLLCSQSWLKLLRKIVTSVWSCVTTRWPRLTSWSDGSATALAESADAEAAKADAEMEARRRLCARHGLSYPSAVPAPYPGRCLAAPTEASTTLRLRSDYTELGFIKIKSTDGPYPPVPFPYGTLQDVARDYEQGEDLFGLYQLRMPDEFQHEHLRTAALRMLVNYIHIPPELIHCSLAQLKTMFMRHMKWVWYEGRWRVRVMVQ